jgi:hypothetical protein
MQMMQSAGRIFLQSQADVPLRHSIISERLQALPKQHLAKSKIQPRRNPCKALEGRTSCVPAQYGAKSTMIVMQIAIWSGG